MEKKNELGGRLNARIQEYLKTRGGAEGQRAVATSVPDAQDFERFRFRIYVHSACPHCHRMLETMKGVQDRGYYVEIAQIDQDRTAFAGLAFPVISVAEGELREKGIVSWPVLLIGDLKKKRVYRLEGYQSLDNVFETLRRAT